MKETTSCGQLDQTFEGQHQAFDELLLYRLARIKKVVIVILSNQKQIL